MSESMKFNLYVDNKAFNDRFRTLAKRFANKPLSEKEMKHLLFYATSCGAAHCQLPIEQIDEYDNWEYWQHAESEAEMLEVAKSTESIKLRPATEANE